MQNIEVSCDQVYGAKGLWAVLAPLTDAGPDADAKMWAFTFQQRSHTQTRILFSDTIESSTQEISFADYNGDRISDILVQNISDARSNMTYYLFLVNKGKDSLRRVRGFEEIKNPTYLPQEDLVSNYVNSGTNWTGFYRIQGDSAIDLGTVIEDELTGDGSYEQRYKKTVARLAAKGAAGINKKASPDTTIKPQ